MPVQNITQLSDDEDFKTPPAKPNKTPELKQPESKSSSLPPAPTAEGSSALPAAAKLEEAEKPPAPKAMKKASSKASATKTKAAAKATAKSGVLKRPASKALKRPAAAIKCYKCWYKSDSKFGLKVIPPNSELLTAAWHHELPCPCHMLRVTRA